MLHKARRVDARVVDGAPDNGSIRPARPGELTIGFSSPSPAKPGGAADPRPASFVAEGRRQTKLLAAVTIVVVVAAVLAAFAITAQHHTQAASSGPPAVVGKEIYRTIPGGQYDAVDFVSPTAAVLNGTVEDTWGNSVFYTMTPGDLENLSIKGVVSGFAWTSGAVSNHTTLNLNVTIKAGAWDLVVLNPQGPGVFGGNQTVIWFESGVYLTAS